MRTCLYQNLIGRFGNCMFQYAYARSLSERTGLELVTSPWVGYDIFDIKQYTTSNDHLIQLPEHYHQDQDSLIYTRAQARSWFKFRPEVQARLDSVKTNNLVSHRRAGDYLDLGYVVVSERSYDNAVLVLGLEHERWTRLGIEHEDFLPDFYQMMMAKWILRGNSSFSWWAAVLGNAKVYSPVIEGLEGGKEYDCEFVEGNWPKFANIPPCTDLYLRE